MNNTVNLSNIVSVDKLREVQLDTLETINNVVSQTAGPYGSSTIILHTDQFTEYSKDGHKVLKNIKFFRPLEMAIHDELIGITEYVVKTVGDGTTSAVQLSYQIFKRLCEIAKDNEYSTREIMDEFHAATEAIKGFIDSHGREITLDDILDICLISTDGNERVSQEIADIYNKYGTEVMIHVGISNSTDSIIKTYDGVSFDKGYSSAAFINTKDGCSVLRNPRIYYFSDPVDTPEMCALFFTIISKNIYEPYSKGDFSAYVPTLIIAPSVTRDVASDLADIEKIMYAFDNHLDSKPPLCIVTGINTCRNLEDVNILCDCKAIRKYINPDKQKEDIEKGLAPTNETITEWYGTCDEVRVDLNKTSFINPVLMFDEADPSKYSSTYDSIINHLAKEIEIATQNNEDIATIGNLKRRYNSLKSNYVEYLVGGVATADRDNVKDLVEDAVLNCRSAAEHGVGYGACFEGLRASRMCYHIVNASSKVGLLIQKAIYDSYYELIRKLYTSAHFEDPEKLIEESLEIGKPINLRTRSFYDANVLCSIETDKVILDAISKIITIMFTANQALIQDPMQNHYLK